MNPCWPSNVPRCCRSLCLRRIATTVSGKCWRFWAGELLSLLFSISWRTLGLFVHGSHHSQDSCTLVLELSVVFFLHHFFKRYCSSSFSFCCHHPQDSACPPVPLLTPAHVAPLRLPLRPLACAHALSHLSIVNGFCVPIKDEHKVMLVRALIPLHKVRMLQGCVNFCGARAGTVLLVGVLWALMRSWDCYQGVLWVLGGLPPFPSPPTPSSDAFRPSSAMCINFLLLLHPRKLSPVLPSGSVLSCVVLTGTCAVFCVLAVLQHHDVPPAIVVLHGAVCVQGPHPHPRGELERLRACLPSKGGGLAHNPSQQGGTNTLHTHRPTHTAVAWRSQHQVTTPGLNLALRGQKQATTTRRAGTGGGGRAHGVKDNNQCTHNNPWQSTRCTAPHIQPHMTRLPMPTTRSKHASNPSHSHHPHHAPINPWGTHTNHTGLT